MTKVGIGFIIAGVLLYFLASQTQIGWLYLFDAIIWSSLVLSAIVSWYSLRLLKVERQVLLATPALRSSQSGGPLEDDTVEIKLKVTNSGRMARYFVTLLEECPFEQPEKRRRAFMLNKIGPKSVTAFPYKALCYRRGHYKSASVTLQSSDPLGLIVRRRTFQLPLNLTVYPTYYQMQGLSVTDISWSDGSPITKSSAAAELYGSREYQNGEPLKHIHWRNTARVGRFMLKEFERASYGSVKVAFPTKRSLGTGRDTTLEYSIKIAASLARICTDYGCSMDIVAGERHLGNAGWRQAMDFLACLEVGGEATFAELIRTLEPGQAVVVIVPGAESELIPAISQLSNRGWSMVVVLLEGFAPNETASELSCRMKGSNIHIISCSPGNLEKAIAELSNFLSSADRLGASVG